MDGVHPASLELMVRYMRQVEARKTSQPICLMVNGTNQFQSLTLRSQLSARYYGQRENIQSSGNTCMA